MSTSPDPGRAVVVLDDRPLVRAGIAATLSRAGFTVAAGTVGAVAVVGRSTPCAAADAAVVPTGAWPDVDSLVAAVGAALSGPAARVVRDFASADSAALTPRERAILTAVAEGRPAHEIAQRLGISTRTVEKHKQNVTAKLGVANHAHATAIARSRGEIHNAS